MGGKKKKEVPCTETFPIFAKEEREFFTVLKRALLLAMLEKGALEEESCALALELLAKSKEGEDA